MICTAAMLRDELLHYGAPANKLMRMARSGEITPIVRGLYETDSQAAPHLLAGSIYGPSYISFEYALAQHGLIPEAVKVVTCASFEKRKRKAYDTPFGRFTYRDIPSAAFPFGLEVRSEGAYTYRIAAPEKALCDTLYARRPVGGLLELEELLFDDLRIDEGTFARLDREFIFSVAPRYHCTNAKRLCAYLRRERR